MRSSSGAGAVRSPLTAAAAEVATLVRAVQDDGLHELGHDELSGLLREARRLQARLEFVALAAVREVDTRGSFVFDGALSTAAWARQVARLDPREASATVRTARALGSGELPGTAAALAAGEVDPAHVRAIAAAVADAPAGAGALIEPEALEVARAADPRAVAAVMRQFRHALDPDAADEAALARYARRGFTAAPLTDGSVHLSGLADEVTGAELAAALDAACPLVPGDRRTAAQRRLDGLGDIARHYLARGQQPRSGGHPQVIVTLDEATLREEHPDLADLLDRHPHLADLLDHADLDGVGDADDRDGDSHAPGNHAAGSDDGASEGDSGGETGWHTAATGGSPGGMLSWVGPIAGSTARRVACDAAVTMVVIDRHGRVVAEQPQRRFFTPAQRRAMIARDGDRCCVPFCDRPVAWSDGHHLKFWGRGGQTSVENGALPCAAHHTMLHEGGWTLHRLPDGRYLMRHRDGNEVGPEPHPPGHHRPAPTRRQ